MLRHVSMPRVYPDPARHLLCCERFQCQAFSPILLDIYYVARGFNAKRFPRSCSTSIMLRDVSTPSVYPSCSTSIVLRDVSMPSVYPDPFRHPLCCEMFQCQAFTPVLFDIDYVASCFNARRHLFCCEMFQCQAFTPILFDILNVARCVVAKRLPRSGSSSIMLREVSLPSIYPDPVRHLLCCEMSQCQAFTPILFDIYSVARCFNAKRLPGSCSTSIVLRDVSMPSVYPDPVRHLLCCEMFQCQAFTPILFDIYYVVRCFNAKRLRRSCSTSSVLRDVSMPSVYPDPVRHLLFCEILFDIYYVARCFNAKRLPRSPTPQGLKNPSVSIEEGFWKIHQVL